MPPGNPLGYTLPLDQLISAEQVFGPAAPPVPLPAAQPGTEHATGLDIARMLGMQAHEEQHLAAEARQGQLAYDLNGDGLDDQTGAPSEPAFSADFSQSPVPIQQAEPAYQVPPQWAAQRPAVPDAGPLSSRAPRPQVAIPEYRPQQDIAPRSANAGVLPQRPSRQDRLAVEENNPVGDSDVDDLFVPSEGPRSDGLGDPNRRLERQSAVQGGAQSSWRLVPAPPGTLTASGRPAETMVVGDGLDAPLALSPEASRNHDALMLEIAPYLNRGNSLGDTEGGMNARLPPGADETIGDLVGQYVSGLAGRPAGSGAGPAPDLAGFGMQARAPVDPGIEANIRGLPGDIAQAQGQNIAAGQVVNAGTAETQAAEAQLRLQQAQEAQQRAQLVAQRSQQRLAAVDQTLEDVAAMRVDPMTFYGGPAGRVTATIAVALGQLGSLLTGGPNVALETINAGLERSMAAQQANIQNARTGVQQQQNALQQFRDILGDEEAAQSATRAALLEGYRTQLQSIMTGLRGPQLQAAQQVEALMAQEAMAHRQAAHQREAYTASIEMQGMPADVANLMQGSQSLVPQPRAPMEPQPADMAVQEGMPVDDLGYDTADPRPAEPQQPVAQRLRPQRTAPNAAGQHPVRTQTGPLPPPQSPEDYLASQRNYRTARREGPADQTGLPDGLEMAGIEGAAQRWQNFVSGRTDAATTEAIREARREWHRLQRGMPYILAVRDRYEGELTHGVRDVQRARALVENIRNEFRIALTGAAAPEDEIDRIMAYLPDPTEQTLSNLLGSWDRTLGQMEAYFIARTAENEEVLLEDAGLVPRTAAGHDYWTTSTLRNSIRRSRRARLGRQRGMPVNR